MSRFRILLIDDDTLVLRTIEKLLKKEDYEIIIADNGQKAIEISKDIVFDLIITDVRMPGTNGIELIEKIKKIQEQSSDPKSSFMIITGYSDINVSDRANKLGVYHFLTKPFDRDLFLKAIESCLRGKTKVEYSKSKDEFDEELDIANKNLIDNFIKEQTERNKILISNKKFPIIGWCNTYVPEEIIIAAKFLPYRITGAPIPLHLSKAYLSGNLCSSIQSILECALNGDYKFLDGMIIGASTDATKKLYDAWIRYVKSPFCHLFDIPKFINELTIIHYTESMHLLIERIKKDFNVKIKDTEIKEAISICNKTRRLLNELNNLRKVDNPPITSQQFLEICRLATISHKEYFNTSIEKILKEIEPGTKIKQDFRILLTGSFQDQAWLLGIIEERGAVVVCEDLCTRLRYFYGLVDEEDEDLIKSIANRYLKIKPASANLVSLEQRTKYLLNLIKEFRVDGVIYYILKFDDPYLFEFPDMKEILNSHNIPVLRIETEHNTSAIGQIMTRVQAFTETLKLAKLRQASVSCNRVN